MLIQNVMGSSGSAPSATIGNSGSPAVAVSTLPAGGERAAASAPVAGKQAEQATIGQVQGAIDKANQAMQEAHTGVEFTLDKDTNKALIKVVDTRTGETIKQFPSEEMIAISKAIDQFQKGLLLRQKA